MSKVCGSTITSAVIALCLCALSSSASAEDSRKTTSLQIGPSRLAYARLYCTPDHESHFAELTADLAKQNFAPPAAPIYISPSQPASSVFFAGFEAHWGAADLVNHLYHPTPAVQLLTVVRGIFSITTTDGEFETATCRRRGPSGRRCALQRAHHGRGRYNGVPGVRSLTAWLVAQTARSEL